MFSEFRVSKPISRFNQVYLDPKELLIDSIPTALLFPGPNAITGRLHLASRGVFFEPDDMSIALVRFKYSDNFRVSYSTLSDWMALKNPVSNNFFDESICFSINNNMYRSKVIIVSIKLKKLSFKLKKFS